MNDNDRIAPLIPWFAAGGLDADERKAVEDHLPGCCTCRGLLETARVQHDARTRRPEDLLRHVNPRLLTQYAERREELEAETVAWIESRLAECETCGQAYESLLAVERHLESIAREDRVPDERGLPLLSRLWNALCATVLRPAPALAYLLVLAIAMPFLLRDGAREEGPAPAATPRMILVEGDSATRAADPLGSDDTRPPLDLTVSPDGLLLELGTALDASDLEDRALSFSLTIEKSGRIEWSTIRRASDLVLREGRVVVPLLLEADRLETGVVHEIVLRAQKPGDPLDGQALFRRSFRVRL